MLSDIKKSIVYPFEDNNWLAKSWLLLLLPLIPFMAIFSPILYKGWRLQMIKNLSQGDESLPLFEPVEWLKNGAILWLVWFAYLLLPSLLLSILGFVGPIDMIGDIYDLFTSSNIQAWLDQQAGEWVVSLTVYLIWGLLAYPLYQAGVIRFALNENWKSVFNLLANAMLLMRYALSFLSYLITWLIILLGLVFLDLLLSFTGIGILIIPLMTLTLYYVTTAYKLGHISRQIVLKK